MTGIAASAPIASIRPLLLSASAEMRQSITRLLAEVGTAPPSFVSYPAEMLVRVGQNHTDLLLVDLPDDPAALDDLLGFCRLAANGSGTPPLPILGLDRANNARKRIAVLRSGVGDCLCLPVSAAELAARLNIHWRKRARLQELSSFRERAVTELDLARSMQLGLLPDPARIARAANDTGISIDAVFQPSSELGGDLWGLHQDAAGRLIIYLVDFTGHGVGAALNTFRLNLLLRDSDYTSFDPVRFLGRLNDKLHGLLPMGQFATMLAGVIDPATDSFTYASAGWTRPVVWMRGDRIPMTGESAGLPLGLKRGIAHERRDLPLPPGGRLLLYSDAAIDMERDNQLLDETGLIRLVSRHLGTHDGSRFIHALRRDLLSWASDGNAGPGNGGGGDLADDLTLLLLTRRSG